MRKNYFMPSFKIENIKNVPEILEVFKKNQKLFFWAVLFCCLITKGNAQTVLIDPAAGGGFESGTTFASNGWTPIVSATPTNNQFTINTGAATPYGVRSCYVTNNIGAIPPPFTYTNTNAIRTSCIYRDITVPAGQSIVTLNFNWRGLGDPGLDRVRIWVTPTTFTPAVGVGITAGASLGTNIGLTEYVNQPAWGAAAPIILPATINGVPIAGSTFRLIFEWVSQTTGTPTTPIAIDSISLISEFGFNDDCVSSRPLTVAATCNNTTFDNTGATNSETVMVPPPPAASTCSASYNGTDVWFRALVGADGTLTVTVSDSGGLLDPVMAAYSGTCNALTQIGCADDTIGNFPQIALTGQTPGSTIYFRVWDWGATQDFGTFNICATAPTCFRPTVNAATAITPTTATINWSPNASGAPSGGYQYIVSTSNTTPVGSGTASAGTSANITGLTQNTVYYVFVRGFCGGTDFSAWSIAGTFTTTIPAPTTTSVSYCQGGTGFITASAVCSSPTNLGGVINGSLNAATDPTALRPLTAIVSASPCGFDTTSVTNYTSINFTVDTTGSYVFLMTPPGADLMGYITTGPFTPGSCATGTWIAGDDDSGPIGTEPQITATLTAGVTYTLYTTLFSFGSTTYTGSFTWNVSGPGSIFSTTAGILQWWTAAVGGTMIGTGTPFNPVGVPGSGVVNNTTPISTTFYAACSSFPNIRTAANFVINPSPTSVISGTGSACATTTVSIALTGTSPWTFTYTDGITPVTITGQTTTPYTFNASPGVATTYTVSALSNATCPTTAPSNRTGSAVLFSKVWNGGTANWNTASNWTPAGVPTASDCVVIANAGTPPIISGTNYYAYGNRLTVNNGATLRVNASNSLTITEGVSIATSAPIGNLILDDDASLVQITDVATNNNTGNVTFNRTASIRRTDYVYWSSPFAALNASLISPATNPFYIFKWNPSIANSNGGQGNWVAGNDSPMTVGRGYIIRAPDAHPTVVTDFTTNVTGVPNNGIIPYTLSRGTINAPLLGNNGVNILATDDNWNLVGNPYPSAIDAVAFLTQNSNLDGNVRLWTHGTPIGSASSSFYGSYTWGYADSYLTYNILGPNPPGFGGKIASGQGFFVLVNEGAPLGINFNNTMRRFDYANDGFFRIADPTTSTENINRSRLWLSILNETNANATTMIGYIDGATLEKDRLFDASYRPSGNINIYSLIADDKVIIQGRPTNSLSNDVVPLGYSVNENGIYKIAIADVDGLFDDPNQDIYLEDKNLGIMHNLRSNYYSFSTINGTFDNRFILHYSRNALGISDQDSTNTLSFVNNAILTIKSTKNIEEVTIHDISGKLIKTCISNELSTNLETDFNYPKGVYLLKIKLDNGMIVTNKLLN